MTCRIEYVPIPPHCRGKAISSLVDVMKERYSIAADTTRAFARQEKRTMSPDEIFDPITRPKHYALHPSGVECITVTEQMNFCVGNAIKYLSHLARRA